MDECELLCCRQTIVGEMAGILAKARVGIRIARAGGDSNGKLAQRDSATSDLCDRYRSRCWRSIENSGSGATPRERDARRPRYQTSPRRAVEKAEGGYPPGRRRRRMSTGPSARRRQAAFTQLLREIRRGDRLIIGTDQRYRQWQTCTWGDCATRNNCASSSRLSRIGQVLACKCVQGANLRRRVVHVCDTRGEVSKLIHVGDGSPPQVRFRDLSLLLIAACQREQDPLARRGAAEAGEDRRLAHRAGPGADAL